MSEPDIQATAEAVPTLSQGQRIISAFTAPAKLAADIQRGNKSWWFPFIISLIMSFAFFGVVNSKVGMQQVVDNQTHLSPKTEERLAGLTPEQRETNNKISVAVTEGIFVAGPFLGLLAFLIFALIMWGTVNFVFGGKSTFGKLFTLYNYAWLPQMIKVILGIIVLYSGMAPESFNIRNFAPTNLAAFLDPVETNKMLYALATSIDVTMIWTLVILSIGVATIAGIKRSSAYIAVFGWWFVGALLGMAGAAFGG
jgi:hypothetical protein